MGRALVLFVSTALVASAAGAQTVIPLAQPPRPIQTLPAPTASTMPAAPPQTQAQPPANQTATGSQPSHGVPYSSLSGGAAAPPTSGVPYSALSSGDDSAPVRAPAVYAPPIVSDADRSALELALDMAKRGQATSAQAEMSQIVDPTARKLALWAVIDAEGEELPFYQLDPARQSLAEFPRAGRREAAAEKTIGAAGLPPAQVIAWFGANAPTTAEGAMALAGAEQAVGRVQDAQALIQDWWRNKVFDADVQRAMMTRFASFLTADDNIKRADTLLYGAQGTAMRDMMAYLPADQLALAQARIALREGSRDALDRVALLPPALANDQGLAVEQARYFLDRDQDAEALAQVPKFPQTMPCNEVADKLWTERRELINAALKVGDYRDAYDIAAHSGMTSGVDYSEAEFFAGWIAFSKLRDPNLADQHFANIQGASQTPITQARALYWRGRAAEARGDPVQAQLFYAQGGHYVTTFYGQLAAGKAGIQQISLGHDPDLSATDRAQFEAHDVIRSARIVIGLGERDLFRTFVLAAADELTDTTQEAQLVDLARTYGDQDLAMRVVRLAAQHDVVLPERGYPLRTAPAIAGAAEQAMILGVTRQESGFDPYVRSGAGARGMMQLMPRTAEILARKLGEPFRGEMLDDPDYNMRLGGYYLGEMVDTFGGSYVMAAAAYNAGPGRPAEWTAYCGDPRTSSSDPVDFIECIPFSETRNYVMRVLEAAEVYRARLAGGTAPITLAADLKRGGYVYAASPYSAQANTTATLAATPVNDPPPH
jgi:soluble lytic murein transglycosylase